MSFADTLFIAFAALLLFGPKKLPEIARTVGKWMNEFRRASNEFRSQLESEIRQIDRDNARQEREKLWAKEQAEREEQARKEATLKLAAESTAASDPPPGERPPGTVAISEPIEPSSANSSEANASNPTHA